MHCYIRSRFKKTFVVDVEAVDRGMEEELHVFFIDLLSEKISYLHPYILLHITPNCTALTFLAHVLCSLFSEFLRSECPMLYKLELISSKWTITHWKKI